MKIQLILSASVEYKIQAFQSEYYTLEETQQYIARLIYDLDNILTNPVIGKTYVEEHGEYKGISRIVLYNFRIYYEKIDDKVIILGIKFPSEN